ncbi:MAG: D-aminoacyl-tRNA deacylase [Bacteroidetes bacterium]|nr:D-aminoacyl-tRNA deacylase [Bacteroidota bacterium]
MRIVIQRVSSASVEIEGKVSAVIGHGLLILLGIEDEDTKDDVTWLCQKTAKLRIFDDNDGVMNLSITEVKGEILLVSQFTLHASTKKGNRPSYILAAKPEKALPLYEMFISCLSGETGTEVRTGVFGAMMEVALVNSGPVTILIDSKNKE